MGVLKAQQVTSDEMFEERLLMLLPYYLMRYEKALSEIEADEAKTAELLAECARLRSRLEAETLGAGDSLLYEQLIELIIRVNDHVFSGHDELGREVRSAMGGEVLELMRERSERLEREAREQGIEQGMERLSGELRRLGADEATIGTALANIREQEAERAAQES